MEQEPGIDFIVRGEGEETIVRLITALEQQQCLEKVPGIVFRTIYVPQHIMLCGAPIYV
jgi:anaerobic magnesium-protoporphyrin IX monomethyl ester cyclase